LKTVNPRKSTRPYSDISASALAQLHKTKMQMIPPFILRLAVAAAVSTGCALADIKLPSIISDHMVLEKAAKVPIWGKADPGEEVTVTLNGRSATAAAASAGGDGAARRFVSFPHLSW
jgi:hypothetical protein